MPTVRVPSSPLEFHPLTKERWADFEKLFGPNGAYSGCWCMWWRLKRSEFDRMHGEGTRSAMKQLVESGDVPGLLAYSDDMPVGWCSVAPRDHYPSLNRSRVLKKLDDTPVWSIVCFFVAKEHRSKGMTIQLIQAAVEYVRRCGGRVVEAYPTRPRGRRLPPVSSYMGLPALFEKAGFRLCAQPSGSKVIMRCEID
jgi:GNAT superfamily N-acetyltransferase